MAVFEQAFLDQARKRLLEEKKNVEAEIAKLSGPEEPMDNPSPEDLASDAAEDIIEESLLKVHRALLERIENGLARLDDGTYGRCLECGRPIDKDKLAIEPWFEYCENCSQLKHQQ